MFPVEERKNPLETFICDLKSLQGIKQNNIFLSLSGCRFWLIEKYLDYPVSLKTVAVQLPGAEC